MPGTKSMTTSFLIVRGSSLEPDEPPQNVNAYNKSSTSLRVEWEEVAKNARNGIIQGYYIICSAYAKSDKKINITSGKELYTVINELEIWTEYNVSVAAYTIIGLGPATTVSAHTEEGSKYLLF